jgi:histidine kinase-like protein
MIQEALSIELPVRPESARKARKLVTAFRDRLNEPTYNDLRLIVSELVADAVRAEADGHRIRIRVEVAGNRILATVQEGVLAYRLKARHSQPGEPGWGVHIARTLGQRWGTRIETDRGTVWVEMAASGA